MGGTFFTGAQIFDGSRLVAGALLVEEGRVAALLPQGAHPDGAVEHPLSGGILAPGFVDLQVNGGDGVMFNDNPSRETLERIAAAHARLGALTILPTLVTDTTATTRAAISAVEEAIAAGVPGIAGIHLEGPHLGPTRKGAHDAQLIRRMAPADLDLLLDAAQRVPVLKITIAPESVDPDKIKALAENGVFVSLGHTDASYAACMAAAEAGARNVTHLYNAMSQLTNREPGLVGAALSSGNLSAGLIADGIHVHPAALRAAMAAKERPGALYLVSDAMAPAASEITSFALNGREIRREDGRLTLADGTLAGADLDLAMALRVITRDVGVPLVTALAMATSIPARVAGLGRAAGHLAPGRRADFIHLTPDLHLASIWRGGEPLAPFHARA